MFKRYIFSFILLSILLVGCSKEEKALEKIEDAKIISIRGDSFATRIIIEHDGEVKEYRYVYKDEPFKVGDVVNVYVEGGKIKATYKDE